MSTTDCHWLPLMVALALLAPGALAAVQRAVRGWLAAEGAAALRRLEVERGPRTPLPLRLELAQVC
jgi:hypothetical protein